MAYIGAGSSSAQSTNSTIESITWNLTAKSQQSTFSGLDDRGRRLSLPESHNQFSVFYNGVRLSPYHDYTHNSSSITFTQNVNSGDIILIEVYTQTSTLSTSSSLTSSGGTFTGTLEGTEFIRNSASQPSGKQLLAQENAPYVGPNSVIRTNSSTISEDVVIPQNTNGMSAGPISISSNVTITINGTWSII